MQKAINAENKATVFNWATSRLYVHNDCMFKKNETGRITNGVISIGNRNEKIKLTRK